MASFNTEHYEQEKKVVFPIPVSCPANLLICSQSHGYDSGIKTELLFLFFSLIFACIFSLFIKKLIRFSDATSSVIASIFRIIRD